MTREQYDAAIADCLAQLLVAEYLKQNKNPEHGGAPCSGLDDCGEKGAADECQPA